MKTLYSIFFSLFFLVGFAQQQIGMSNAYTITPSAALSPTQGTYYDSIITVKCFIKNTGTVNLTGLVSINKRVDTLGGTFGTVTTLDTMAISNLVPNDSLPYIFNDTIKPFEYKQYGNGNTIVVWPFIQGATTSDTLFTSHVYVNDVAGIEELSMRKLLIYPNPGIDMVFIKPENGVIYDKMFIYDVTMKKVREEKFSEEIDISLLPQGSYWINVTTKNNKRYVALITKMH